MNKKLAWMRILLVALLLMCSVAMPVVAQQALDIAIDPDPPVQGQILTVTVTSDGNPIEGVLIQFSLNDGTPFYAETNGTGQAVFKPELIGTLKIVATKEGYASETMETDVVLAAPPAVTVTSPDGGEDWKVGSSHAITWTAIAGSRSLATNPITIEYSTNNGATYTQIETTVPTNGEGSYTWTIPSAPSTACLVKVIAKDITGMEGSDVSDASFTISEEEEVVEEEIRRVVRGGGGGPPREPEMNVPVDPETGEVLETTMLTVDGATLTFPKGTVVKDAGGNPLATSIFMLYAPTIAESVGAIAVYDFGPAGLTFEPAIDLVIPYDPADIPAGFDESDLVVRMWDGTAWIDFVTSIDTEAHVATAKVSHFTIFGLFAAPPVAAPPTPTPVVMPPPAVTPTPTPTPPVPVVPWVIVLIAIVAAVIIVAVAYVVLSRRKS
ncbi:MAG: hypothetical protein WBD09_08420 [Halobacteriota archaeon]